MPEKRWDAVSLCEGCDVEMIIEFSWGTGKMSVDPDLLILEMPMVNYRKWLKLFIKHGERNDHIQMIHCLCNQLISVHNTIKRLEAEVHRWDGYCG